MTITLKQAQLNKFKEIFLESSIKYQNSVLEDKNISLGQIPAIPNSPHINLNWTSVQRTPEFTGVGDKYLNNYDFAFILRSNPVGNLNADTVLQNITDNLNDFATNYLDYLLDTYRYGTRVNDLWYMITQTEQTEVKKLDKNNFYIVISLQTTNY